MDRLNLPYKDLAERWLCTGLASPPELTPLLAEKHSLLHSIHKAHPDTPCRACGSCCPTFPFTTRYVEYHFIRKTLEEKLNTGEKRDLVENKLGQLRPPGYPLCPFLSKGRCTVYMYRPLVCRRAVAGETICLKTGQDAHETAAWTGRDSYSRFLALNCLVNYIEERGTYREIGLRVPGKGMLIIAPFEFWFFIELGCEDLVLRLLDTPGYLPPLRWAS